ncbi:MAG TPA: enoyl-CoA hydratase-related protein [Bacteroidia bacterium]|nr:enoyl-CoA hydratase-related protein [Bacteroidia bacterium]
MTFENILTKTENGILVITINRPDKLNALNKKTIEETGSAVSAGEKDEAVKIIIITGSGLKSFIAGADISEFADLSVAEGEQLSRHGHVVFNKIENCEKPVIAAINGFALGGGCELAMSCHIRVASDNAKFGQPEAKLGLIPGYGGTQRLTMLIGKSKAMELLMTTDMISAADALSLGLINYVTTPEQLMNKCIELAEKIKQQAPLAIAGIIRSVNDFYNEEKNGYETEITEFGKCFNTHDFKEGSKAFLEKRKAAFKGK